MKIRLLSVAALLLVLVTGAWAQSFSGFPAAGTMPVGQASGLPAWTTTLPSGLTIPGATITGATISSSAISGGTITGLPSPSNSGDAATKQYVDNTASGLVVHSQAVLATAAALAANTYNNGTAGVGATLTANANGNLVIDGTTNPATNTRVVVKNESTAANNGIYTVTTTGGASQAWVLTRATDANTPGTGNVNEIGFGSYVFVTTGTANANTSWIVNSTVTTIGTSAINWVLFSSSGNTTVSNSDSTLTISPNSGSIVASLNLAHANTWTGALTITTNSGNLNIDTPSASEIAAINLKDHGTNEWSILNHGDSGDVFAILDQTASRNDLTIAPNGNMSLMPGGGGVAFGAPAGSPPTGGAVTAGNLFIGGGQPWVDVKSGSNSCAAATGNGSSNDQSAISCQITAAGSPEHTVFLPCGVYLINGGGLASASGYMGIQGENQACTEIEVTDDETAISWATGAIGFLNDVTVSCYQNAAASSNCVNVGNNATVDLKRVHIVGGNWGLKECGIDGHLDDAYINGYNGGNVLSCGANWYGAHVKLDNLNSVGVGFEQTTSFAGASSAENHFVNTDISGTFSGQSVVINDGGADNAITIFTNSVFSSAILEQNAKPGFTIFLGNEIGSTSVAVNNTSVFTGNAAFNSTVVTGSGAASSVCGNNFNLSC